MPFFYYSGLLLFYSVYYIRLCIVVGGGCNDEYYSILMQRGAGIFRVSMKDTILNFLYFELEI